jgi:hypothetical protein
MKYVATKPATYESSLGQHHTMFDTIKPPIVAAHVCHLWRVEESKGAKMNGENKDSINGVGHWAQRGAMELHYLSLSLEMDFIRQRANFPSFPGCYSIERAVLQPTQVRFLFPIASHISVA